MNKKIIFKERRGATDKTPCWVAIDDSWLYIERTLLCLVWTLITEWQSDKHIVGY